MKVDLLKFYRNESKNNRGVALSDIWHYSDAQLEKNHHFIQWLFPTNQKSAFNWSAPVLYLPEIILLKNDATVIKNFRHSLIFFLRFYGLMLHNDNSITFATDFDQKAKNWISPNNHNYKRISRILRFLTIFEFTEIKDSFTKALNAIYKVHSNTIGEKTYSIWMSM